MDKKEASTVIAKELRKYRSRSYGELRDLIGGEVDAYSVNGPSGTEYQIEVQVFWDGEEGGNLMVSAGIDDGGIRAFFPLPDSFIMSPDGKFVGEE